MRAVLRGGCVAAALLVGCGALSFDSQPPIGVPGVMSQSRELGGLLYVGGGTRLSEYASGQTKPVRSLKLGYNDVCELALGSSGDAFAGNCNPSYPVISVYDRQLRLLRSIIGLRATALAVDRFGYLYVATCTHDISVFAPGRVSSRI